MNKQFNNFEQKLENIASDDLFLIFDDKNKALRNISGYNTVIKPIHDYLNNKFKVVDCVTPSNIGEIVVPYPDGFNENNCVVVSFGINAFYTKFFNRTNPVVRLHDSGIVVQNEDGVIEQYKNVPCRITLMRFDI